MRNSLSGQHRQKRWASADIAPPRTCVRLSQLKTECGFSSALEDLMTLDTSHGPGGRVVSGPWKCHASADESPIGGRPIRPATRRFESNRSICGAGPRLLAAASVPSRDGSCVHRDEEGSPSKSCSTAESPDRWPRRRSAQRDLPASASSLCPCGDFLSCAAFWGCALAFCAACAVPG